MQQGNPAVFSTNPEMEEAFRHYLREIKLDKNSPYFYALKYFLAKALYPHLKTPPTLLDSVVCPLNFPSLEKLIACVTHRNSPNIDHELLEKLACALDDLMLKPYDLDLVIQSLLHYPYKDARTTMLVESWVRKIYEKANDKNSAELHVVIDKILLSLLQVDTYDRSRNFEKIAKLCEGLSGSDQSYAKLIANFTAEQIQWLFYRLLAFENQQNFLRGNTFATKLSRYVMNQDKQLFADVFNEQLDNVLLAVLSSAGQLQLETNKDLAEKFVLAMQSLLNWLMTVDANQFPGVAGLCVLIYNYVTRHPDIKPDRYSDYVSGYLVLRFLNTMLLDYKENLTARLRQDKFKSLKITPQSSLFCNQLILTISRLFQGLATKSEKMTGFENIPAVQGLRSSDIITRFANWILTIGQAKQKVIFKETSIDTCYYDIAVPAIQPTTNDFKGCSVTSVREVSEPTLFVLQADVQDCAVALMLRAWFDVCYQKYKLLVTKPNLTFHQPSTPVISFAVLLGREEFFNPIDRVERMLRKIDMNCQNLTADLVKSYKGIENMPVYSQEQINQKIMNLLETIKEVNSELNNKELKLSDQEREGRKKYLADLGQELKFNQSLFKLRQLQTLKADLEQLKRQCAIYAQYKNEARNSKSRLFSFMSS